MERIEEDRTSNSPQRPAGGLLTRHAAPIGLALLIVVVSALNLAWILRDRAPLPVGDSYHYLTRLLRFIDEVGSRGLADLGSSLQTLCHGWRPPLYQFLTVPFVWLFGRSEDAATAVNFVFWILLLVSVYQIGKLAGSRAAGLLAAVLVVSYPPIVHLSRMFLTHSALPACVALSTWLLLLMMEKRSLTLAWLFSASLACGVLIHANFALVMTVPALVVGAYMVFFQTAPARPAGLRQTPAWIWSKLRDPLAAGGLLPGGLAAAAVAIGWYSTFGRSILAVQKSLLSQEVTDFRGKSAVVRGFQEVPLDSWWFAVTAPGAISLPLALAAAVGLVYAVVKWRRASLTLALIAVAAFIVLALRRVYTWMYFAPVLPIVAVLSALWIVSLRPRKVAAAVAAVAVSVAGFTFSLVTWGERPWNRPLARALGSPLDSPTCRTPIIAMAFCPSPTQTGSWPIFEILDKILEDRRCRRGSRCRLMMLQVGEFKAPLFQYYQFRHWKRLRVPVRAQGHLGMGHGFQLAEFLESDYLLFPRMSRTLKSDRNYLVAGSRFLECPPLSFVAAHQTVAVYELPDGKTAELIRRTQPLSLEEAEDSIAALELRDVYKQGKDRLLDSLAAALGTSAERPSRGRRGDAVELETLIETGRQCLRQDKPDRALEFLEPAVARAPERGPIHTHLALAYDALGRKQEMFAEVEKAVSLGSDRPVPLGMLADEYRDRGRHAEAIELYREIVEKHGATAAVLSSLAQAYRAAGELDAAAETLEKAIALEAGEVWRYHLLARIHNQRGEPEQARDLYRLILEIDPQDERARRLLSEE